MTPNNSGIYQGCILGPLLFTCNASKISEIVTNTKEVFADNIKKFLNIYIFICTKYRIFTECKNDEVKKKL